MAAAALGYSVGVGQGGVSTVSSEVPTCHYQPTGCVTLTSGRQPQFPQSPPYVASIHRMQSCHFSGTSVCGVPRTK